MSIVKETLGMGKGDFAKSLSSIVDNHRANTRLIGKPRDFVITACRLSSRFSEVANRPDVEVRVEMNRVGPRKVKMIVMKEGGKTYPVPKGQLVDNLFPPKKIATSASPEKKHAHQIRATMRRLVDQQMRDYRKQLKRPCECFHTGKMIRIGMKMDIDHVGKPFIQLADEFVAAHDLTYCEIQIYGPPNLKSFRDKELQRAWQLYHEMHARLAPSLARANRSAGSGEYNASEALIGSFKGKSEDDVALDF